MPLTTKAFLWCMVTRLDVSGACRFAWTSLWNRWGSAKIGYSHIILHASTPGTLGRLVICNHLPHSGRPFEDFRQGCESLYQGLSCAASRNTPILLCGDFNDEIHLNAGTDRGTLLRATLDGLGLQNLACCSQPTWRDRRIEHVICNAPFSHLAAGVGAEHSPWACVSVRLEVKEGLEVDHAFLLCESLFNGWPKPRSRKQRAATYNSRPCKMQATGDPRPFQDFIFRRFPFHRECVSVVHSGLQALAQQATTPVPSIRYVDPPNVRDLCRQRSVTWDREARRALSLRIYKHRQLAKRQWHLDIISKAANGDWACRRYLRKKWSFSAATRPLLERFGRDPCAVAHAAQERVRTKFSDPDASELGDPLAGLPDSEPSLQVEEVIAVVNGLKGGKGSPGLEVVLKVLTKLAMQCIVPQSCFGSCCGRGVAEALYTVKACAQESCGLQTKQFSCSWTFRQPLTH